MTTNRGIKIVLMLVLCLAGAGTVRAQSSSILDLADSYARALHRLEVQKGRSSIEAVFNMGKVVAERIEEMEALSDADYLRLQKKMRGFDINREEILFIEADAGFYKALSKTKGIRADLRFFDLIKRVKPNNVWAAYIEQQTDVSGCTLYGTGLLTRLYGFLLAYKKTFPQSYKGSINAEIGDILQNFSESGCACGGKNSVVREFQLFIKTFPKDRQTPSIKSNLETFKKAGDFRFNCQSG